MKSYIKSLFSIAVLIAIVYSAQTFGQDSSKADKHQHKMKMEYCKEKRTTDQSKECCKGKIETKDQSKECMGEKSTMQKDGNHWQMTSKINFEEFDKNKDEKVFQCSMCPDQISDDAGSCPKCGMKLKEVLLEKTNENMKMHESKMKNKY
ncbi:MAG: heavy metal-binding domain-containing protein [Melioribacteraceae bacterium]|nr:heavy metal-binding domain-containing protein [Melioribacteraceae bacterium]